MDAEHTLEFVNRVKELRFIEKSLTHNTHSPTVLVIRAPSGFGKSSLTDQLHRVSSLSGKAFCIVDPLLRGSLGTHGVYDGFFMQRVAESLDRMGESKDGRWPKFCSFLKQNKQASIATKSKWDAFKEFPSIKHLYKVTYDYAARAFSFDNYSPEKLLKSDSSEAIATCSAYAEYVLANYVVVLIVREVQHCDILSLKTLLLQSESNPGPDLIVEYTSSDGSFSPEHHKLMIHVAPKCNFQVLDLIQLEEEHLEYLIKRNVRGDFELNSEAYIKWDGNLRSIIELKFQVSIGRKFSNNQGIGNTLANLTETVVGHAAQLSSVEKAAVSVVLAHVEPIEQSTLVHIALEMSNQGRQSELLKALDSLESHHAFISRKLGSISILNDTIADALGKSPSIKRLCVIAEKQLRDHYSSSLRTNSSATNYYNAVRQYFRLCASTYDVQGLNWAVHHLSEEIRKCQDQSLYIDIVASAIEANPELYARNCQELIDWAAELAYSVSDWYRVASLLELNGQPKSNYALLMYACSLQEIGRHDESLEILSTIRQPQNLTTDESVATRLVEALIIGCRGEHTKARAILDSITSDLEAQKSPLVGYAFRFYEITDSIESALVNLTKSIEHLGAHGLVKSKAYSQLAAAMLMARTGEVTQAQELIKQATNALSGEVRDQYIALNNGGAVELLSDSPNFIRCIESLNQALKYACDDFSELTILVNLSLAYIGNGQREDASRCADKCRSILDEHDFADTGIYWPTCFNISVVFRECGEVQKSKEALSYPFEKSVKKESDSEYWDYRFGLLDSKPTSRQFLCSRKWHPLYLSHWLIDQEGLSLLKTKLP